MPEAPQESIASSSKQDLTEASVGRYIIRARLGAGGMGEVYLAEDTRLKRSVAIKRLAPRLQPDNRYHLRLLKEAQRASALNHPNIAAIYDVLEEKGEVLLVMEHIEGNTLRQRIQEPLSLENFYSIALQCAEGLAAAHERGIIHGDIKPDNIMLTPEGRVKILDFGVARRMPVLEESEATKSSLSITGEISGTPAYMAPEVLLVKDSDGRADIFSLGVVFYEMLSGENPFKPQTILGTSDLILHQEPAPLSGKRLEIPQALSELIAKTLAKDLAQRCGSAAELLRGLRSVEQSAAPAPAKLRHRGRDWQPRLTWRSAAGVGSAVIILALLALFPLRNHFQTQRGLAAVPELKNLAVLPFYTAGNDPQTIAFGDGLVGNLTAQLTQLTERRSLQVVPASEVRSQHLATAEQARQSFGANLVLEGNIERSGKLVRVNYTLVDTSTRRALRADTITAPTSDTFAVEGQVAASVLRNLNIVLQPGEKQAFETYGTSQSAAYDYYLQGRGYLEAYQKPEDVESAIQVFRNALKLDPNYGLALAGLGEAYWRKYEHTHDPQLVGEARAACEKALDLESAGAESHVCLGLLYNGTGQYEQAGQQYQKALELEPTRDSSYQGLALAYERLNRPEEAERTYRQAIELRPQYSSGYNALGSFFFNQARYGEAADMFERVVKLSPDSFMGYSNLGGNYTMQGRYQEAIQAFQHSVSIRPTPSALSNLATAYFDVAQYAESAQTYEAALKLDDRSYFVWGNMADAYYWAPGKREQAAPAYQKAVSLANGELKVNPRDASLWGYLATYHAMLGEKQQAFSCLERALQLAPQESELLFNAALVHNQFQDTEETLKYLGKALKEGYPATALRDTPNFQNLRTNSRFVEMLKSP